MHGEKIKDIKAGNNGPEKGRFQSVEIISHGFRSQEEVSLNFTIN
jgi:hypothetical protein